jgi:tetratricopeptide (TPR) repeat protein
MGDLTDTRPISRLEIVDTGRRRRWSAAEKRRIVEESFSVPRLASATARRHRPSSQLLFTWRKAYREGRLGASCDTPTQSRAASWMTSVTLTTSAQALDRAFSAYKAGKLIEAEQLLQQIAAARPDFFDAFYLLAYVQSKLGKKEAALTSNDRAITLRPDHAEALSYRGVTLYELKRYEEALASYDRALKLRPDYAEALSYRGVTLYELKRYEEALASYDRALKVRPDYAEALSNRGNVLHELKRYEEALASCDHALKARPDYAKALNNRGNVLHELKRFEEALASYDRALKLRPDFAEALANRGNTLQQLKRFEEALASYDRALTLLPDYAEGHFNEALTRLLIGDFERGWAKYEWRWETKDPPSKRPNIKAPTWRGEDLSGRHLLVFGEQGLGDVIQFARYLPPLVERECRISFLVPAKLHRLLRPFVQPVEIVSELRDVQGIDFQIALASLPQRFNAQLSSIPNKVPYLTAEPDLEARWRARVGTYGFKIGIAWQGNPGAKIDDGRSIPLEKFIPLSRIPGVRLISLQKYVGLDQLARLPRDVKIETPGDDLDNGPDAFIDTAAVMSILDLIITSDTSIAHLAGALGRPTWVALKHVPDWRWLLDREDSPWYPTLRLFRQTERDDWRSAFSKIERQLRVLFGAKAT